MRVAPGTQKAPREGVTPFRRVSPGRTKRRDAHVRAVSVRSVLLPAPCPSLSSRWPGEAQPSPSGTLALLHVGGARLSRKIASEETHVCPSDRQSSVLPSCPRPGAAGAPPGPAKTNMFVQSICFQRHLPRGEPSARAASLHGEQMTPTDVLVYDVIKQRKSKQTLACSLRRRPTHMDPTYCVWLLAGFGPWEPNRGSEGGQGKPSEGPPGRSLAHISGFSPRLCPCGLCPPPVPPGLKVVSA